MAGTETTMRYYTVRQVFDLNKDGVIPEPLLKGWEKENKQSPIPFVEYMLNFRRTSLKLLLCGFLASMIMCPAVAILYDKSGLFWHVVVVAFFSLALCITGIVMLAGNWVDSRQFSKKKGWFGHDLGEFLMWTKMTLGQARDAADKVPEIARQTLVSLGDELKKAEELLRVAEFESDYIALRDESRQGKKTAKECMRDVEAAKDALRKAFNCMKRFSQADKRNGWRSYCLGPQPYGGNMA